MALETRFDVPSLAERARRYARLRELMAGRDLDVLVVVGRDGSGTRGDLRYVGAYGPVAPFLHYAIFPRDEVEPVFVSRLPSRHPLAKENGWINDARLAWLGIEDELTKIAGEFLGSGAVGIARLDTVPVPLYLKMIGRFGEDRVQDAAPVMEEARLIKSDEEIHFLKRAAEASDAAVSELNGFVKPGCIDFSAYGRARQVMHELGSEYSMDLISCGRGSFAPIGDVVGEDGILSGELTPAYSGYYNQLRFEFRFGKSATLRGPAVDALHTAYDEGVAAIEPGVTSEQLYDVTRVAIERQGFAIGSGHFGHGTGLDVAEGISIEPGDKIKLVPGIHFVFHPKIVGPDGAQILLGGSFAMTESGAKALNKVEIF